MDVDSETRYHQVLTAVYLMGEQRLEAVTKDTIATIQVRRIDRSMPWCRIEIAVTG